MAAEPALRFWLQALAAEGGIVATTDEPTLVLVPDRWQRAFDLPDEMTVTADPDVAREEQAAFVTAGEPQVVRAAEMVLGDGDAGWGHLAWPALLPPSDEAFQTLARDHVVVDGGEVGVDGQPAAVYVPVVRLGVVIRYTISLDDRFEENEEIWVDGRSGRAVPKPVATELGRASIRPGIGRENRTLPSEISRAVATAHRGLEDRATARRAWLAAGAARERELELKRAEAHYDAALGVISARSAAAPPSGQSLYAAQSKAIRAERSRRLLEIGQQPPPTHEIRPYRLHVVGVPALRVPVVIRRGPHSFTISLDWYLPFSAFGPLACPHCLSGEALVVSRDRLGCRRCVTPEKVREVAAPRPPAHNGQVVNQPAPGSTPSPIVQSMPAGLLPAGSPLTPPTAPTPTQAPPPSPTPSGLAVEFWDAVAEGRLWPRRSTAPASPLEILTRLFGAEGPLRAVGMPSGRRPRRLTSATIELSPADRATSGRLGSRDLSLPYTLRWRLVDDRPIVTEVLPFPSFTAESGSPLPVLDGLEAAVMSRLTQVTPLLRSLGPVEDHLWQRVGEDGFPFVVRCLAVWRRLEVRARLAGVDPSVLAASVALVSAHHSGIETTAKTEAERHAVSDFAVGHVSRQLNTLVRGLASPLW